MNIPSKRQIAERFLLPTLTLILGSAVTYLYFIPKTTVYEQRVQLRKEIVKAQYHHLQEFERFAERGTEIGTIIFVLFHTLRGDNRLFAVDSTGFRRETVTIVYDSTDRAEWENLANRLKEIGDKVDPEVFEAFSRVLDYVIENPLPPIKSRKGEPPDEAFQETGWYSKKVIGHWLTLNKLLIAKIDKIMSLVD